MAFFEMKPLNIAFLVIGIAFVVGGIVIVALKIFHQNKEEKQIKIAANGMAIDVGKNFKVGDDLAVGKYVIKSQQEAQPEIVVTLNGEEKTVQSGDMLELNEDDVLSVSVPVVATICQ